MKERNAGNQGHFAKQVDIEWLRHGLTTGGLTLEMVGQQFGVTREAVRQFAKRKGIVVSRSSRERTPEWYAKKRGKVELESKENLEQALRAAGGISHLVKKLGLSDSIIRVQAERLGVDLSQFVHRAEILEFVCEICGSTFPRTAADAGRGNPRWCSKKCQGTFLASHIGEVWSDEEDEFLNENWQSMTDDEIAEQLNKSADAVKGKRHRLGLLRRESRGPFKPWMRAELSFVEQNWEEMTDEEIGRSLGRTPEGVRKQRSQTLNLKRRALASMGKNTQ